jgi:hypothetical protein
MYGASNGDASTSVIFGRLGYSITSGESSTEANLTVDSIDAHRVIGFANILYEQQYITTDASVIYSKTPVISSLNRFAGRDACVIINTPDIDFITAKEYASLHFSDTTSSGSGVVEILKPGWHEGLEKQAGNLVLESALRAEIGGTAGTKLTMDLYGTIVGTGYIDWTESYVHQVSLSGGSVFDDPPQKLYIGGSTSIYGYMPPTPPRPPRNLRGSYTVINSSYSIIPNGTSNQEVYTSLPILFGITFGSANTSQSRLSVSNSIRGRADATANMTGKLAFTYTRYHEADDLFTVCTNSTRPDFPNFGDSIYETDTGKTYMWTGSSWEPENPDGRYFTSLTGPTGGGIYK